MRRVAAAFFVMACLVCAPANVEAQTAQTQNSNKIQVDAGKPFLHPLFGDHVVLQRDVRFPVWGWTTPGARVNVSMRGREATVLADARGRWTARLGPFDAGGPFTLTVKGPQSVTLNDVLVGDVWLASGQSNMEMGITQVNDAQAEVAHADYPQIRLFAVPKVAATSPRDTVNARWLVCNPTNVVVGGWGGFSAVAYFFGRRLHKELGVPIGLIHSSWGGTAAEGWVSAERLSTMHEFLPAVNNLDKAWADSTKPPAEYDKELEEWWAKNDPGSAAGMTWADSSLDASGWKRMRLPQFWEDAGLPGYDGVVWFRRTFELPREWEGHDLMLSLGPVDDRDTTYVNGVRVGSLSQWDAPRSYRVSASLLKHGANTIAVRVLDTGVGGGIYGKPEQLKIEPAEGPKAVPVSLAGEWSYRASIALGELRTQPPQQGGNDFSVPEIRYNGMIAPLLPFAIKGAIWYQGETNVGRAPQYERIMSLLIRDWRERFQVGDFPFLIVQLANYLERRDAPADSDWARLREAQLHVSRNVPHSGLAVAIDIGDAKDIHPKDKQDVGTRLALDALANVYGREMEYSGPVYRSVKVEGDKLRLSFDHAYGGLVARDGGRLTGFALAGKDGRFVWADAVIEGKDVLVSSPEVKRPTAARYAWADNPACNLYNRAGLPASPFRTDDLPAGGPTQAARQ
jgi:sialate O-acetylesterase